jgi:hypothetical protein
MALKALAAPATEAGARFALEPVSANNWTLVVEKSPHVRRHCFQGRSETLSLGQTRQIGGFAVQVRGRS